MSKKRGKTVQIDGLGELTAKLEQLQSDIPQEVRDACWDSAEAMEKEAKNHVYDGLTYQDGMIRDSIHALMTELDNSQAAGFLVVDRLSYQIDLWGPDVDDLRTLAPLVNAAILSVGFLRTYSGPLELEGSSYYRKTMRFGRSVDKRTMRLID